MHLFAQLFPTYVLCTQYLLSSGCAAGDRKFQAIFLLDISFSYKFIEEFETISLKGLLECL